MPISSTMERGAAVYSPLILKMYDWWVLGLSNRFAWQCPTHNILLPFFKKHLSRRHLDVGVGTGFYLAKAAIDLRTNLTLLDLNGNSLNAAARRIHPIKPNWILHNILNPLPLPEQTRFDSISLFYVLHCLPGIFADKEPAIINLKRHLTASGILYGATILGESVQHNRFGQQLVTIYNKKGIFSNKTDTIETLQQMLERHFPHVHVQQEGKVALFTARNSKKN